MVETNEEAAVSDTDQHARGGGRAVAEPPDELRLDAALVSVTGARPENEDAAFAGSDLLVVADGVGGNVGGAVASALAVEAVRAVVALTGAPHTAGGLRAAVESANARLAHAVAADPGLAGMATTLTAVTVSGDRLELAHVGDTRAYLLRDGRLRQLTEDQTVVQSLVDAGLISVDMARTHPLRSVLLGALHGADGDLQHVTVAGEQARSGDRLLVCSDGLSGVVEPSLVERVLAAEPAPAAAASRLVRAALAAGTHDDVTVVVADVVSSRAATVAAERTGRAYSGRFSAGPPTS